MNPETFLDEFEAYCTTHKYKTDDTVIRNEMISAALLSCLAITDNKKRIQVHIEKLIEHQHPDGYWIEYAYDKQDMPVGFYGCVPTAIAIFALCESYQKLDDKSILFAAIRGADYLYSTERNGNFLKSKINKADVINTNMLAALALLKCANLLEIPAKRKELYIGAAHRSIRRSYASQHSNGAYPYTYGGITVPFLYHLMTLSLLIACDQISTNTDLALRQSIISGLRFSQKIIKNNAIRWEKERFKEKSGAIWTYGWLHHIATAYPNYISSTISRSILDTSKNGILPKDVLHNTTQHPFYSGLTIPGLYQSLYQKRKNSKRNILSIIVLSIAKIPARIHRIRILLAIIRRKATSIKRFDPGAIEHYT